MWLLLNYNEWNCVKIYQGLLCQFMEKGDICLLILVLKLLLLFLIFFGLAQFLSYGLKIKSDFIPVTLFTGLGIVMFFAGVFNVLPEMVNVVSLFSLGSLVYVYWKKRSFENIFSSGMVFFLIGAAYFAFFMRGMRSEFYDDFTHWGLVVKEMLMWDHLPNFTSTSAITHQAYPPGTAVLLYFVSKILGDTESVRLYAQALVTLSCLSPLAAFMPKRKYLGWLLVIPATLYLLSGNLGIIALTVDTLLSLLGIAGTAILAYYYTENKLEEAILPLVLITSYLNIVKNSGILFVIILAGIFFAMIKNGTVQKKKAIVGGGLMLGLPYVLKVLWDKHIELVFWSGAQSRHAMTVENYKNVFAVKSQEDIWFITKSQLIASVNIHSSEIKILLFAFVAVGLIWLLKKVQILSASEVDRSKRGRLEMKLLFFMAGIYVVYQIGLWGTYTFSMPLDEALILASYDRYNRYNITIIMYLLGVVLIYFLHEIEIMKNASQLQKGALLGIGAITMLWPLYLTRDSVQNLYNQNDYSELYRTHLEKVVVENQLPRNANYIIYSGDYPENDMGYYIYFMSCYELMTGSVSVLNQNTIDTLGELNDPVTIIIMKDDEKIREKMKTYGIVDFEEQSVIQLN